ncbi:MAG: AsmA family protein [Pseudomonadota bacterium]
MARFLKIAAIAASAILLVLLAAAVYVATTVRPDDYKAGVIRLVQEQHQRTLSIPGKVKLTFYPRIGANFGRVTLSERGGASEFAAIDSARVSVALLPLLRNDIVIDRIDIRGMRAKVVRFADGSMNTGDLTSARAAAPAAPAAKDGRKIRFGIESIRVDNAHLLFDDRKTGRTLEVSHLNIDSGAIARGQPAKLALSANVRLNKPAFNAALTFSSSFLPDAVRRRIAFTDVDANLDISLKDAKVKLAGNIDLDLDVDEFAAELKGRMDESSFDVKAGRRAGQYQLMLDVDQVDLGRYKARLAPVVGATDPAAPEDAEPVDLSGLADLRASGSIHVGALKAGAMNATNVRAVLRSDAHRLTLEPIAANMYGGAAAGSLSFDFTRSASTPRITVVQNVKGAQVGPLLMDAFGKAPVDGKGDLRLDLSFEGASVAQMRQSLAGTAALQVTGGAVNGIDVAAIIRNAAAGTGAAALADKTGFAHLGASFTVANGVAHNEDLMMRAPLLSVAGTGDIDLAREQIDFNLACTLAATGIALPVKLYGPWSAVNWRVDSKVVSGAAVKKKAQDKLKATIKSLIKRRDSLRKPAPE